MSFSYLLFDLDGTLTDPGEGITNSVAYALEKFGIRETDRTKLYRFIGPPLITSFREYYGFSEEDAVRAVACYREYFTAGGMFENQVYPGIDKALSQLSAAGKTLLVATSKPEPFAKRILEHFGLAHHFRWIAGASLDEKRSEKWDVIEYALATAGIQDRSKAVMIGDRKHDIIGAKKTGLSSTGVLWGYGNREELETAGADRILAAVPELASLI